MNYANIRTSHKLTIFNSGETYIWCIMAWTSPMSIHSCTTAVLNRWPPGHIWPTGYLFVAPELLFLHHVFWLGQYVYTGTCLHANDTQTAGSLTAASKTFNFHFRFRSSSRIHILLLIRDWKWRVSKQTIITKWTVKSATLRNKNFKFAFFLLPVTTRPTYLRGQQ